MTSPYPSRREAQRARTSKSKSTALRQEPERTDKLPSRRGRHHLKRARHLALGVAAAGLVLLVVLIAAGARLSLASKMEIRTVPAVLDMVEVSGEHGRTPVVLLNDPVDLRAAKMRMEIEGDGRELTEGSPILLAVTAFDGETGKALNEGGEPNIVAANLSADDLGDTLADILVGRSEGSRLVVGRPVDGGGTELDVVDVLRTTAHGEPCGDGVPSFLNVSIDGPALAVTLNGEAPSDLLVECIIQGDGPQIHPDDDVVIQYVLGAWSEGGAVVASFVGTTPTTIDLDEVMPGLENALVDQRVGTRLAVAIPPDMATGEDTMFAVVDVLAIIHQNTTE